MPRPFLDVLIKGEPLCLTLKEYVTPKHSLLPLFKKKKRQSLLIRCFLSISGHISGADHAEHSQKKKKKLKTETSERENLALICRWSCDRDTEKLFPLEPQCVSGSMKRFCV